MESPIEIISKDQTKHLYILKNKEEAVTFAVNHFVESAKQAISDHGKFFVALSGGSTPKAIFHLLATSAYKEKVAWDKVYLFWSDERSVPPDHPESNYKMAMDAGFLSLPIPKTQIFRMKAEQNIEKGASDYEALIHDMLQGRSFDLIMLGMGDDGHTASLFPGTEALKETKKWVVANTVPQKETERMTMTFPCINQAKEIVVYILGASKKERIQEVLQKPKKFPIGLVGDTQNPAKWILDEEAAEFLLRL